MKNDIDMLQSSIFMDDGDEKYLESLAPKIVDVSKMRRLFCDFESQNKKSAKQLCLALQRLGFDSSVYDFENRMVESSKLVNYTNSKYALNLAMYEAWKHNSELTTLMLEQDKCSEITQ